MKPFDNHFWKLVTDFGRAERAQDEAWELVSKVRRELKCAEDAYRKAADDQNLAYDALTEYVGMAKYDKLANG